MQEKQDLEKRLIFLDTYIKDYWNKKSKRLGRILHTMDQVEYWVMEDEEEFVKGINRLGRKIELAKEERIDMVLDQIVTVIAYMSSSKAIRLINWLEDNHPEILQKIIFRLPKHEKIKAAKLLSTRLKVLQNLELMSKVFGPDKSNRIKIWLTSVSNSQGAVE